MGAFLMGLLPIRFKVAIHTTGRLHDVYHLGLFVVLGALAMLASGRPRTRLMLLAAAALLGLGIEVAEAARFHEGIEGIDIFTDSCGVVLGAAGGYGLLALLHRKRT